MLSVDTNVLVRLFTDDDHKQRARAASVMDSGEIWIAKTVLLETEWVLRSSYGFSQERVIATLRELAGLRNLQLEDPLVVSKALDWFSKGIDFADGLHLASAGSSRQFATFDTMLAKRAARIDGVDIVAL